MKINTESLPSHSSEPGSDEPTVTQIRISPEDQRDRRSQFASCLVVMAGDRLGQRFPLEGEKFRLGRQADLEIPFSDPNISRVHATIFHENGEFQIRDHQSKNGAYVNDTPVQSACLKNGDIIRLGGVSIRFVSGGSLEDLFYGEMLQRAHRDALTGALNKAFFGECLEGEMERCKTLKVPLCLVMVDLDHFKWINDTYGHVTGDRVLKAAAEKIQACLRRTDLLSRYGGEEFCVLLSHTPLEGALTVAERIRRALASLDISEGNHTIKVTGSLGIAALDPERDTLETLIQRADFKMYTSKQRGRDLVSS